MGKLVEDDTTNYFEDSEDVLIEQLAQYIRTHSIKELMELIGEVLDGEVIK